MPFAGQTRFMTTELLSDRLTLTDPVASTHEQTACETAAFFDLDGTLIGGSANIPLAKAAFRRGLVTPVELLHDLRHGMSFLLKGASDDRSAQVRDRILRAVSGHPASDVEALGDDFMDDLVASVRPAMNDVLLTHALAEHDRIVLSASPTEIVSRFARESGLESGIGTTSERDAEGRYTGRLAGPFCYREGKVAVMVDLAAERGYDLSRCYAYSDSASDLPMLEAVGHPVVVNPEPELRRVATQRRWPIVETSAVPRGSWSSLRGLTRIANQLIVTAWGSLTERRPATSL